MSSDKIQLCASDTAVQLCAGGTKIQLCDAVPASCPTGLADAYDVAICGQVVTVTRPVSSTTCLWEWSVGGLTGCGFTLEYIAVSLNPGVEWSVQAEQGIPSVPSSYEGCFYNKTTGLIPIGTYNYDTGTSGASCGTTASVSSST